MSSSPSNMTPLDAHSFNNENFLIENNAILQLSGRKEQFAAPGAPASSAMFDGNSSMNGLDHSCVQAPNANAPQEMSNNCTNSMIPQSYMNVLGMYMNSSSGGFNTTTAAPVYDSTRSMGSNTSSYSSYSTPQDSNSVAQSFSNTGMVGGEGPEPMPFRWDGSKSSVDGINTVEPLFGRLQRETSVASSINASFNMPVQQAQQQHAHQPFSNSIVMGTNYEGMATESSVLQVNNLFKQEFHHQMDPTPSSSSFSMQTNFKAVPNYSSSTANIIMDSRVPQVNELFKQEFSHQMDPTPLSSSFSMQTNSKAIPNVDIINPTSFGYENESSIKSRMTSVNDASPSESSSQEDPQWETQFKELRVYHMHTGHCKVPARFKANPKLGRWVMTQRRQFTLLMQGFPSALTTDRIQRLEQLGFTWSVRPEPVTTWNKKFHELKTYKTAFGTCMVPQRYTSNPQLGTWVHTQRRQYKLRIEGKKSSMTGEKVDALNSIGFNWDAKHTNNDFSGLKSIGGRVPRSVSDATSESDC